MFICLKNVSRYTRSLANTSTITEPNRHERRCVRNKLRRLKRSFGTFLQHVQRLSQHLKVNEAIVKSAMCRSQSCQSSRTARSVCFLCEAFCIHVERMPWTRPLLNTNTSTTTKRKALHSQRATHADALMRNILATNSRIPAKFLALFKSLA